MDTLVSEFAALCERLNIDPLEALNHLNICEQDLPVSVCPIPAFTFPDLQFEA